ncbi:MAG: hypothetical protein ACMG57_05750 [Candidatus Dojkabacteria bacterium]
MNDNNTQDPVKKPEDEDIKPEETTEVDMAPTTEIAMPEDEVAVDHESHTAASTSNDDSEEVPSTWLKLENGKFKCSECENEVEPETNTIEGVVKADLDQIKADLTQYPTKVIYGICPVCGMEYVFRLKGGNLYLEPSDLEK